MKFKGNKMTVHQNTTNISLGKSQRKDVVKWMGVQAKRVCGKIGYCDITGSNFRIIDVTKYKIIER